MEKDSSWDTTTKTPTERDATVHVVGTNMAKPYPVTHWSIWMANGCLKGFAPLCLDSVLSPARGYRRVGNICTATDLQIIFLRKPHQHLLCNFITSPAHHTQTACINLHHQHSKKLASFASPGSENKDERLRKRRPVPRPKHCLNSNFLSHLAGPSPHPLFLTSFA